MSVYLSLSHAFRSQAVYLHAATVLYQREIRVLGPTRLPRTYTDDAGPYFYRLNYNADYTTT